VDDQPEEPDEPKDGHIGAPRRDEPLEAFYGTDDIFGLNLPGPRPEAPRVPPKKARTATGALLTGIALGLRDVFDPEKKKDPVAIEQVAPTEPDGPKEWEIHLRPSPRDSQAVYRPWVRDEDEGGTE
jgi:hypothetical protein